MRCVVLEFSINGEDQKCLSHIQSDFATNPCHIVCHTFRFGRLCGPAPSASTIHCMLCCWRDAPVPCWNRGIPSYSTLCGPDDVSALNSRRHTKGSSARAFQWRRCISGLPPHKHREYARKHGHMPPRFRRTDAVRPFPSLLQSLSRPSPTRPPLPRLSPGVTPSRPCRHTVTVAGRPANGYMPLTTLLTHLVVSSLSPGTSDCFPRAQTKSAFDQRRDHNFRRGWQSLVKDFA